MLHRIISTSRSLVDKVAASLASLGAANRLRGVRNTDMRRVDWPLVALAATQDGTLTPVQIQKTLFLLAMEAKEDVGEDFYKFEPYNYGPFDRSVYSDLEILSQQGLVIIDRVSGQQWPTYRLTSEGRSKAEELETFLSNDFKAFLEQVVGWLKPLRFSELIGAIYKAYPDFKVNSIFTG